MAEIKRTIKTLTPGFNMKKFMTFLKEKGKH